MNLSKEEVEDMIQQEEQDAMDRLRRYRGLERKSSERSPYYLWTSGGVEFDDTKYRDDVELVAGVALEEHDSTTVTAEWLKSLCKRRQDAIPSWRDYGKNGVEVFVRVPGGHGEITLKNPACGQLIRLIDSLYPA